MTFEFSYQWSYYPLFGTKPITTGNSISGDLTIRLYPLWYKQITVEWFIPVSWGSCTFNVYKSATQDFSEFTKLNVTPISGTYIKDTTTQDFSKVRKTWYIVEAINSAGKRIQSSAITWENKRSAWVELRAQEIQRREYILLSKFTGVESYILRRKTYGKRCGECWNPDLEKATKDKCITCMGSTFEGGYFDAIKTFIQYDPSPNSLVLEYFGKWEKNQLSAWTISFPEIRVRDLIYRTSDAALFNVDDYGATELQTVPVRQMLVLVELDKESPEYKLITTKGLIPSAYTT